MTPDISQGDVYWAELDVPLGSEPGYRRPCIVVQNDALNNSRLPTVVIVALTTTLRHATAPGNVLIPRHDAGLKRDSVALATQIRTVDRASLVDYAGHVSSGRLAQVLRGVRFVVDRVPAP